jgi:hypothetical protein
MKRATLVAAALALSLTACGDTSSFDANLASSGSSSEGSYGSNATLDALQDRCEDGDSRACDRLFTDSPLGSDYEEVAQREGGKLISSGSSSSTSSGPDLSEYEDEIHELALRMMWDQRSSSDQRDMCTGMRVAPDLMYSSFTEGMPEMPRSTFNAFFNSVC